MRSELIAEGLTGLINAACRLVPGNSAAYIRARITEAMNPIVRQGKIALAAPGLEVWNRSIKYSVKEKDTLSWIENLPPGDVMWDVGANIGVFTLLAVERGLKVVAFEPEAGNFWVLQRNLDLNAMHEHVTAFNIGLGAETGLTGFITSGDELGLAQHRVIAGEGRRIMVYAGAEISKLLGVPAPDHVKIDVDGFEVKVVAGMDWSGVKSAQIELRNNGDAEWVMDAMRGVGFTTQTSLADIEARGRQVTNVLFER